MPLITFPDGQQRSFEAPVTGLEIAQGISPSLAKKSVVIKVNGELWDLTRPISADARVELVTRDSPEALEVYRHDAAHVLAQAVQELFPGTQITFGPATETGFYYDFVRDEPFTEADLAQIEARMKEIVKRDLPIRREVWDRARAIEHFKKAGESYKAEWIQEGIAPDAEISIYRQGDQWLDLCTGPHLPSTGRLGTAFKLMKVSGAYWRGDRNNAQLQRIYGTAFPSEQQLKDYLKALEEAEKRDHRKLGRKLDFFHLQEESPGMVFWHDKGWLIYTEIQDYLRRLLRAHGYQEVRTPEIVSRSLWEKSGHWDKFRAEMFTTNSEERDFAVKPMNCPCHVQIYNHGLRSYRDLPLRMAEFGSCHRNEPSGALHGLMRVRAFTQDDAHIFCTEEQVLPEVSAFIDLLFRVYRDFGFDDVQIKLSTRPAQRVGSDESWDRAEKALEDALNRKGLHWQLQPGEGAFYGPKIEFSLKDCLGRVWQCGTIQLDFSMPERLGAEYVAEDNSRKVPVMLHRAILGSLERFIGILIEHHAGAMPLWLAPVQAVVLNITDRQADYAREVAKTLGFRGLRVETDLRNEKIGFKIREHTIQKVPYLVVVGDQEVESQTVAVRTRGGENRGSMTVDELAGLLAAEIASRGR
ncbi:MAG TPA: threonine--tRNA ligase [Nevskiales bacterium]|nr:threonine--tRNA ligase [Nevskiales bacterium]